jgi:hypothetical protein
VYSHIRQIAEIIENVAMLPMTLPVNILPEGTAAPSEGAIMAPSTFISQP